MASPPDRAPCPSLWHRSYKHRPLKGYKTLCRGHVNLTEVLQRDMAGDLTLVDKSGVPMAVLSIQHLKSSPGTGGGFGDDEDDGDSDDSISEHVRLEGAPQACPLPACSTDRVLAPSLPLRLSRPRPCVLSYFAGQLPRLRLPPLLISRARTRRRRLHPTRRWTSLQSMRAAQKPQPKSPSRLENADSPLYLRLPSSPGALAPLAAQTAEKAQDAEPQEADAKVSPGQAGQRPSSGAVGRAEAAQRTK